MTDPASTLVDALPPTFAETREALRTVACYVLAPARRALDSHIWLAPVENGFGIPLSTGGSWIGVRGDRLVLRTVAEVPLTTLRAAAQVLGLALEADPGVGDDLPPFLPDAPLAVDATAARALASWYAFGAAVHAELAARHDAYAAAMPAKLWPEHLDLAIALDASHGRGATVGASAGDGHDPNPYLYVGPWDRAMLESGDPFWDAPFGGTLGHAALRRSADPISTAAAFVEDGLRRLGLV